MKKEKALKTCESCKGEGCRKCHYTPVKKAVWETLWEMVKWEIFMERMHIQLRSFDREQKRMRTKYCRKGYHKLSHSYIGQSKMGQFRMRYVHFLKCRHCNYVFFARPSDKKKYLEMTKEERSAWLETFSRLKSEQHIEGGKESGKDASVS